ncbi:MAG: FHA domain-containing protein [Chloroflexi bacterium]|nr:FHA domain-containing protein [Chloroflexota bacterium]MBI3734359.1 FHA domain-containing protein [Chloroflexota bacterium]
MIRCKSCGAAHPPNTLFCDECGDNLLNSVSVNTGMLQDLPTNRATAPFIKFALIAPENGQRVDFVLKTELLIGRTDPSVSAFPEIDLGRVVPVAQGVSRRHARVFRSGQQVMLEDLNSLNGTYVRGLRLASHRPQTLQPGDELRFGQVSLRIDF